MVCRRKNKAAQMRFFSDIEQVDISENTVLALGKFDGLHLGHRRLIAAMVSEKEKRGAGYITCALLVCPPGSESDGLISEEGRLALLERLGVDCAVRLVLDEKYVNMPAEAFLRDVLVEKLHMKVLVAGPDLSFGRGGEGNAALIEKISPGLGFKFRMIEKETFRGEDISSSRIRQCLQSGKTAEAEVMLGEKKWTE